MDLPIVPTRAGLPGSEPFQADDLSFDELFLLVTPLGITFTHLVQDSTKPTGILALLPDRVRVGLIRQRR